MPGIVPERKQTPPSHLTTQLAASTEEENKDRATIIFLIVACDGMFEKRASLLLKRVVTEHVHHDKSASTSTLCCEG